ncbi:MAG: hypothetical protein HRT80_04560 [Henriciella sp.]|nr:hypothetical protein [Henriciella sp.]
MDHDKRQSRIDFEDLQGELSGSSNKAARFFDADKSRRNRHARDRDARDKAYQTQLDLLMLDPIYAAAFERVSNLVDDAQDKLNAAIDQVAQRIEHLEGLVTDMENRTAKLPDGTAVFRAADGSLKTADGRDLTAAETALLINADNLLSYERYNDAHSALHAARARQDGLSDKQAVLDDARRKMDDSDNPPSQDDLDDIEKDITRVIQEMETANALRPQFQKAVSTSPEDLLADLDLADGTLTSQPGGQAR